MNYKYESSSLFLEKLLINTQRTKHMISSYLFFSEKVNKTLYSCVRQRPL